MSATTPVKQPLQLGEIFSNHVIQQLKSYHFRQPPISASVASASSYESGSASGSRATLNVKPPLFVAMQGPQGSGKTTVTRSMVHRLTQAGYNTAVLSMDDLYHTHTNLTRVAKDNPSNPLLSGRGQPGTHDIELGTQILDSIYRINSSPSPSTCIELPIFDKSLFNGEGDRAPSGSGPEVKPPLDIFVLEGWSMGFSSIPSDELQQKQINAAPENPLSQHIVENLAQINQKLKEYEKWYRYFSVFLQIAPTDLQNVYTWRLQQEHAMKASNGGNGMSDQAVKAFVDRYMPGYYLFLDTIHSNQAWKGRGKTVTIDLDRNCIVEQDW